MRKVAIWIMVILAALMVNLIFTQALFAQEPGVGEAKSAWTLGVPGYTGLPGPEAIVVESGKVTKVEPMKGVKDGLQMRFVTDQGNKYLVYMGPKWFIENQKIKFMAGDKVEVRGKKYHGAIIASEISKGDWTMKLRNEEDGMPSWECCFPRSVKKE